MYLLNETYTTNGAGEFSEPYKTFLRFVMKGDSRTTTEDLYPRPYPHPIPDPNPCHFSKLSFVTLDLVQFLPFDCTTPNFDHFDALLTVTLSPPVLLFSALGVYLIKVGGQGI